MSTARVLVAVSLPWLALSLLFDGLTLLLLPYRLAGVVAAERQASVLGITTLVGLGAAVAIQPLAGAIADRLRPRLGRRPPLVLAAALTMAALAAFGGAGGVASIAVAFVLVQVAASGAQAVGQTLIPERVEPSARGRASGLKGAFDVGGAFLAFVLLVPVLERGDVAAATWLVAGALAACTLAAVVLLPAASPGSDGAGPLDEAARRAFVLLVAARFLFLLGTFAVGRFLVLLVANRLAVDPRDAVGEAGLLLAALTLLTAATAPIAGWVVDRAGGRPVMAAGSALSAAGIALLAGATSVTAFLAFGARHRTGAVGDPRAGRIGNALADPPSRRRAGRAGAANAGRGSPLPRAVPGVAGPARGRGRRVRPGDPLAGAPAAEMSVPRGRGLPGA